MACLMMFQLSTANSLVLKDSAWYTKDVSSLKRLDYYISIAHTENINHMSAAGLFKANLGEKIVDGIVNFEDCDLVYVSFKFKNDEKIYFTFIYDVELDTLSQEVSTSVMVI